MESLTQKKLRELLKSRGLSPRGNKVELVQRMKHWEEHKTLPAKKEKRKLKRKSDGGGKPHSAKRKKENGTTNASHSNNKRIKREPMTALELFFTNNHAMALLTPTDKLALLQVCKLWNKTNTECGVLGFNITTQFASAYLGELKPTGKGTPSPVPTFILRTKPYNICFGVDVETNDVACLILNEHTVVKALHSPKDDASSSENDPLSNKFKDLKAYCPEHFPLDILATRILLTCVNYREQVGQVFLTRVESTNQLLGIIENALAPHIRLKKDKQGWPRAHYCLQQLCVIVVAALHELTSKSRSPLSVYNILDEYTSELALAKARISEYLYKFDESNNFLLANSRQIYQEVLDVISSFSQTVVDDKTYTGVDLRAEMQRMLGFLASCQDKLQNDWLERLQRVIECHISAQVDSYTRFAHRDLQDLKNLLAKQLPGILHTPERVKEVLYSNIQEMDRIVLNLREQGRVLCNRSLPGKKTIRSTKPDLHTVKREVSDSSFQYSHSHRHHHHHPPQDEQVTIVESSDLMNKLRLSMNPLGSRFPHIDMQQAAQGLFMDLCRKYRELTTPDINDPHSGDYSLKGWQYFVEWLPQVVQRAVLVLEYGDPYNALYFITQLSMLLLKNECSWLRWSHYFEEEDTGDLEHKAIHSTLSALSEISTRVMPTLRRDEMLRRWFSYTLRDITTTNLAHLADEDSLMIEMAGMCQLVEEITSDIVMTSNEVPTTKDNTSPTSSPSPPTSPSPPPIEEEEIIEEIIEVKEPSTPPLTDSTAPATPVLTEEEADM